MSGFIEDALSRRRAISPQFDYMWRVSLPSLGDAEVGRSFGERFTDNISFTGLNTKAVLFDDDFASMKELNHRVNAIDVSAPSYEVRKVIGRGMRWKGGMATDVAPISIKMHENEDGATLRYLDTWLGMIQREDGTQQMPAYYKKNIELIRMSVSSVDLHITTCVGCFPIEVGNHSHSYDSNNITNYNITFSVDEITHKFIPFDEVRRMIEKEQVGIANSPTNPFSSGLDIGKHIWQVITGV